MRKIWLIFAQSVTACLGLLFVIKLFYPHLLESTPEPVQQTVIVEEKIETVNTPQVVNTNAGYSQAAQKAMPSVVNIFSSSKKVARRSHPFFDDPLFKHFFGDQFNYKEEQNDSSLGSGVIVNNQGYIMTNNHVVNGADKIEVALTDGRKFPATIIGTDPETDLAILKVEAEDDLPAITFADPEQHQIGDVVLAIGNPFGVGQTVTQGIVSALGRNHLGINTFENFIQTDASINPGNSGGALINSTGDLIGINTAIYSRSGGSMGIGFAIPVSIAKTVMEQLTTHGSVTRGWIGIEAQDMTPALAHSFGLDKTQGSLIAGVIRNGPADQAGLKAGDILIAINNQEIVDSESMLHIISVLKPQQTAIIDIIRNKQAMEVELLVGKRPKPAAIRR